MTLGIDTTDESILWNPGEPKATKVTGEVVDAPNLEANAEEEAPLEATADLEEPGDTGLQPEGEVPSPPEDLKENTNVETDAIKGDIEEAGPVPEATDVEINGDPAPVSEPNPEPGTVTQP